MAKWKNTEINYWHFDKSFFLRKPFIWKWEPLEECGLYSAHSFRYSQIKPSMFMRPCPPPPLPVYYSAVCADVYYCEILLQLTFNGTTFKTRQTRSHSHSYCQRHCENEWHVLTDICSEFCTEIVHPCKEDISVNRHWVNWNQIL